MTQKKTYTDDEFRTMRRIAIGFAMKRTTFNEQTAEDFAQEYCLAVWRGKCKDMRVQLIDFLRKHFGRTDRKGSKNSRAKSYALRYMVSYESSVLEGNEVEFKAMRILAGTGDLE